MENLDIRAMDSRDAYGRDRFLPLPLEYHLTLGILTESSFSWYGHPSFYPVQMVHLLRTFFFVINHNYWFSKFNVNCIEI